MSRVLVTGASGNVGSEVVRALRERGGDPFTAPGFDFEDERTFAAAVAGCDSLFLLRPPPISRVGPTLNRLVDVAAAAGVRHCVFLSVAGADRNPIVPHHRVERYLKRTQLGWTILRPGFFAQNVTGAYRDDIVRDGRIYIPAGSARVAFVDAFDLGELAAAILLEPTGHKGRGYHLTGPVAVTLDEVAGMLTQTLGRPVRYEPATVRGYVGHLRRQGLPTSQLAVQTVLHVGLRRGQAEEVDPTLGRLLGRPPRTMKQFLAANRAAF